ncbi:LptA/OstA family protein [Myxococcus virescens]|uniref:LptA/OstA family protein n=1 Tax=Myxococcus virescens TaxID=83456 RepID=UPI003DA6CAC7
MIEFLVMAFFVAQPAPAVAATPAQGTPPAAVGGSAPTAGTGTRAPTPLGGKELTEPVQINGDHVTFQKSQATLTGNVKVKHRTLDLKCDRMTANYTPQREVTRVVCTGGVHAVDGDRMAKGERAEYDVPSGVLVVTGSPEAHQGTTHMRGTKVRLTLGNERLEVENAVIVFESLPSNPAPARRKGRQSAPRPAPSSGTAPSAQGGTAR